MSYAVDLLEDFTPAELEAFERMLEPRRFAPGETLFVQGAAADGVHFVRRGRIRLGVRLPGGDVSELAVVGPGEALGELLLGSASRTATATAMEAVESRFMPREEFLALYENFHPASLKLMHRVARSIALRIAMTNENLGRGLAIGIGNGNGNGTESSLKAGAPGGTTPGAFFNVRPFLPKLLFFRGFGDREIDALLEHASLCEARRGSVLFRAGDAPDAAFIVVRGAVEVLSGPDGALERIALHGPGTIVGDMAALLDAPRIATCRVREDAVLLELPASSFRSLLDPQHKVAFKFLRALLASLIATIERTNRTLAGRERARRSVPAPSPPEGPS